MGKDGCKKKRKVQLLLFRYGIVPMLLVVQRLEEREDYENAAIVNNAIKEHCKKYDIDAPEKYSIEAKRFLVDSMNEVGLNNYIAVNNIEGYANSIEAELNLF